MKRTKNSLLFSAISLLLCISMLLGTTYAWFTDSVTSNGNRIVSGTLDVEMYWSESLDGPWHNVEEERYNTIFNYDKWEPGYTELRYIKIVNKGNLALKYQLSLSPAGTVGKLAEVIDVYFSDSPTVVNDRAALLSETPVGTLNDVIAGISAGMFAPPEGMLLPAGTQVSSGTTDGTAVCSLALHMQENAGNEYQGETVGEGFFITLVATQASYESDSFGEDYDEDASFPVLNLPVLASAAVTTDNSGVVTQETAINEGAEISAVVSAGTKLEAGTDSVTLTVKLVSENGNINATDGTISRTLDVHVSGIADDNTQPVIVTIENALPINMNLGAINLYHTENGVRTEMTKKTSAAEVTAHNDFYYNSVDGSVIMALKSFSEILFEVDEANPWDGNVATDFAAGEGTKSDPFMINTADQLAYLAKQVNDGTPYSNTFFKLGKDIVLNTWDNVTNDQLSRYNANTDAVEGNKNITAKGLSKYNDVAFEQQSAYTYNGVTCGGEEGEDHNYLTWTPIGNGSKKFSGTFDGNNHYVSGLFKLWYKDPMESSPMGLFGWVHNGTVKNLTVKDSFIYTYGGTVGLVSAYASGSTTFENVKVKDNFVTSYNYPMGGILGMAWQANADGDSAKIDDEITFNNVTVDNSNLLEALWGTYDSSIGGIVGTAYPNTEITFNNVTSWPEVSLYNDCCANYQWFAYRYSGMLIGYVRASDRAAWLAHNVHCSNVVVKYGEWTDQYYCECVELGKGSYNGEHEWKYQRISKDQVKRDSNGNVTGCDTAKTGHNHDAGKSYTYKGQSYTTVAEDEDHIAVKIEFNQLFGGGQGVYGETLEKYKEYCTAQGVSAPDVTICDAKTGFGSISVKLPNTDKYLYRVGNRDDITIGTLFQAEKGTNVVSTGVTLKSVVITGVTGVDYTEDKNNWENGKIKFTGTGVVRLTLEYRGIPTVLNLEVIDAVNATSAVSATSNNVCLLADTSTGNSTVSVSNGYTFYGNGFTVTNRSNGEYLNTGGMGSGYFSVNTGSTLDNLKLDCAIYPRAYVYDTSGTEYVQQSDNLTRTDGAKNYYGYQYSAVAVSGGTVSNCYIKGARNNILISGNATIVNTTCDRGSLSNIHMTGSDENTVTLDNVTTIQYLSDDDFGKGKKVEGVGVLVGKEDGNNPNLVINNSLTQYNWVCNADKNSVTSSTVAKTIIGKALDQSKYVHTVNGTDYVNMGVLVFNDKTVNITDNRANHHCDRTSIELVTGVTGQVYTVLKDYGTVEKKDSTYQYTGSDNNLYVPVYKISDLATTKPDESADTFCWNDNGTIRIQFKQKESFSFDVFQHIGVNRYTDESVSMSIDCEGATIDSGSVVFSSEGTTKILITVLGSKVYDKNGEFISSQNYTLRIPVDVHVKKNAPNARITVDNTNLVNKFSRTSNYSDYYPETPVFNGVTIIDYDSSGNEYYVLNGSNSNQADFLGKIRSISSYEYDKNSDTNTWTITLVNGTTLQVKHSGVYKQATGKGGEPQYKQYNNVFYIHGKEPYASKNVTDTSNGYITIKSYSYTGENGVTVSYDTARKFDGLIKSNVISTSSPSNITTVKSVVYKLQGGVLPEGVNNYATGSKTTLPTPTRYGYTFSSWNTKADGSGASYNAGAQFSISSNTDLYAIWAKNVEAKFRSGGSIVATVSGGAGTTQTLPGVTQETNWLEGWYTEADGGTKIGNPGGSFTMPSADTTYYAHWSPKYYVIYDANGGSVTANYTYEGHQADIYEGTVLTMPKPTNGSKTFEGWFTAAEGGTLIGTAGDSYTPTANIELFAQWSDNILVTFNGNGGTAGTNSATYDNVTPITLPSATWAGHQFNGWYTAASGGTRVGNAGASYVPTEPTTLYAQWTAYTVSFDGNGASNPSALSAGSNGSVTLPTPTRTGYTFNGWYTATSGGTKVGNGGASYTPTANVTLHAQWTVNTYKVTITTSNSSTAVTVNGTAVNNGGSIAYNSVVKVVLSYTQSNSLTFTIKQGNNNVTYYSNEACTTKTTSTAAGTYYFKMPAGDVTINSSAAGSSSCVVKGTLITLADGTRKAVEDLTMDDMLLVWNLETGEYDIAPMVFIDSDPLAEYTVMHVCFSDGSDVGVVSEHGFFDLDLGKYVYISEETMNDYVGHRFVKESDIGNNTWEVVTLTDVWAEQTTTTVYSPVTAVQLCYFTNGILSMPGGIEGLFNIFDVDTDTMTYDAASKQSDIDTYGLLTIEDYGGMITEDMFYVFNGQYLGIAVGKGQLTWEYITYLAERYAPLCE